jgi:hypothetical protein
VAIAKPTINTSPVAENAMNRQEDGEESAQKKANKVNAVVVISPSRKTSSGIKPKSRKITATASTAVTAAGAAQPDSKEDKKDWAWLEEDSWGPLKGGEEGGEEGGRREAAAAADHVDALAVTAEDPFMQVRLEVEDIVSDAIERLQELATIPSMANNIEVNGTSEGADAPAAAAGRGLTSQEAEEMSDRLRDPKSGLLSKLLTSVLAGSSSSSSSSSQSQPSMSMSMSGSSSNALSGLNSSYDKLLRHAADTDDDDGDDSLIDIARAGIDILSKSILGR